MPILIRKIHSLTDNAKWLADFAAKQGYGNKWFYTKYPLGEIRRNKFLLTKEQKAELLENYRTKIHPSFWVRMVMFILHLFNLNYDTKDYTLRLVRWGSEDS